MTEVGSIVLDLQIKAQIEQQLEKIRAAAVRPAEKLGEALSEVVEESLKLPESLPAPKIEPPEPVKLPEPDVKAFEDAAESLDDIINRALERMKPPVVEPEITPPEPVTAKAYVKYDQAQIMAEIDELCRKAEEPVEELSREMREKLGTYEIPTDPVQALQQEIGNTYFKLDLLQKKWQELSAADPSDKVCTQLQSVQQQIISTTKTAEKLEKQLSDLTNKNNDCTKRVQQRLDTVRRTSETAARAVSGSLGGSMLGVEKLGTASVGKLGKSITTKLSKPITSLLRSIKRAVKSVFLMAGVYAVLRSLKDGILQAAMADERFAKSLDEVKGNLMVAFVPVIQAALPMLSRLMAALAGVTRAAASFISGFFGTTFAKSAEAAKKLKATADLAKKTKLSLAGIDEMNILSKDDSESKSDPLESLGDGDKKAENLGAKVRRVLSAAFDEVGEKAKTVFGKAAGWADKSFRPTFVGLWDGLLGEGTELYTTLSGIFSNIMSLGEPLKDYFSGDFTSWMQTCFSVYGSIALGLFDTFNMVFGDIWSVAVFPVLTTMLTTGLPLLTQFSEQCILTAGLIFGELKKTFDLLWTTAAKPVLELLVRMWQWLWESAKKTWDKWGVPIFTKLRTALHNSCENFRTAWSTIIQPIFSQFMATFTKLWDEHISPFIDNFLDFVCLIVDGALDIYNKCIAPMVRWFVEVLGPPVVKIINFITETWGNAAGSIWDAASSIIDALKGVVNFLIGVFTGDWKRAWDGIKQIFSGVWGALVALIKGRINEIIDVVNGMIRAVCAGMNGMIGGLNKALSVDIPSSVPVIGGTKFGLDLPDIDLPEIPHLAKGGIVTEPTLAMIGDNRNARSDPEVVAPLSKLREMSGSAEIVALLNIIIELLHSGMNIEIVNYLFENSEELRRIVLKIIRDDQLRGGV